MGDDGRVVVAPRTSPPQLSPPFPSSEQVSLLTRWTDMMYRDLGNVGNVAIDSHRFFTHWTAYVPRYIGISPALDDAAKCYLDCRLAFVNPTDTNLLAVQTSKFKGINSVRLALEIKGSRPEKGDVLIAVYLLYMVEVSHME